MERQLITPFKTSVKHLLFKQVFKRIFYILVFYYRRTLLVICGYNVIFILRNLLFFNFYVEQIQHTRLAHYKIIPR
jgi:hypothetical protein